MTYQELRRLAAANPSEAVCSPRWFLQQTTAELERLALGLADERLRLMAVAALSSRQPRDLAAEEAAADARDTQALTTFFKHILAGGLKPSCRRLGSVRHNKKRS